MDRARLAFVCYSGTREGTTFPVERWPVSIGRHPRNTIVLENESTVSSHHCRVVEENNEIWVYDLKSDNGTYVNGTRVEYRAKLSPNASVLGVGPVKLGLIEEARPGRDEEVVANLLRPDSVLIPPTTRMFRKAEEVVLVVDVAESTRLGVEHGDASLVKNLWVLARVFERSAQAQGVLFMKCTGDGFLATFETCGHALTVACDVLAYFVRPDSASGKAPPMRLRFALHRGLVMVNEQGDRFGLAVHLCARLEGLRAAELTPEPGGPSLPSVNRILVTAEICKDIPPECRAWVSYVGTFTPRGFADPVKVYAVSWEKLLPRKPAL